MQKKNSKGKGGRIIMAWIINKILEFRKRHKKSTWELYERLLKRCPALTYENLDSTKEELDRCERMIEEVRQRLLKEEEARNCSTYTK